MFKILHRSPGERSELVGTDRQIYLFTGTPFVEAILEMVDFPFQDEMIQYGAEWNYRGRRVSFCPIKSISGD